MTSIGIWLVIIGIAWGLCVNWDKVSRVEQRRAKTERKREAEAKQKLREETRIKSYGLAVLARQEQYVRFVKTKAFSTALATLKPSPRI